MDGPDKPGGYKDCEQMSHIPVGRLLRNSLNEEISDVRY